MSVGSEGYMSRCRRIMPGRAYRKGLVQRRMQTLLFWEILSRKIHCWWLSGNPTEEQQPWHCRL